MRWYHLSLFEGTLGKVHTQQHKTMVTQQDQRISTVPRLELDDTHPVTVMEGLKFSTVQASSDVLAAIIHGEKIEMAGGTVRYVIHQARIQERSSGRALEGGAQKLRCA